MSAGAAGATSKVGGEATPSQAGTLKRNSIGFIGIFFFVIAAAAPMAAFVGASPVVFSTMGPAVPLVYLLVAAVIGLFAVGYLKMSRHVVSAGGFVAYISRGLGRHAATGASGIVMVTYLALQVGLWSQFGVFAQQSLARLGLDLPVWLIVLVFIAATTTLAMFGVDLNLRILGVLIGLEVMAIVVFVIGLVAGAAANGNDLSLASFSPSGLATPGLGVAVLFVFTCFTTFEATTVFSEEARNPRRTIPLALYAVVVFVGLFYSLATWAVSYAVGPDNIQEAAAGDLAGIMFALAHDNVGPWLDVTMQVLVVVSFLAMLIGMQNMFARYVFALARARVLPRQLSRVGARSQAPSFAALAIGVVIGVLVVGFLLAGADPIEVVYAWFVALGTIGFLVIMALASVAIVAFFLRERIERGVVTTILIPILSVALMIGALVIALQNFEALLFSEGATAMLLLWLLPIAFVAGAMLPVFKKNIDFATVASAS